jgi:hypothetical protein
MTFEIILLNTLTNSDGSFNVNGVFWLTANSNNIVPLPNFISQVPFIDISDLNLLKIGTLIEQSFNSGNFASGTSLATVQSTLQTEYTTAQSILSASNPALGSLTGATYNGSSWTSSSPFTESFQNVVTGNLGALNATVQIDATGSQTVGLQIMAGTLIGDVLTETSFDGGTTWNQTYFSITGTFAKQSVIGFASANTATGATIIVPGGTNSVRIRVFAYTSGTCAVTMRASNINDPTLATYVSPPANPLPPSLAIIGGSVTTAAPTYSTGLVNTLSLNTSGGLRVDGSGVTQPVSGTVAISGTIPVSGTLASTQSTSPWVDNITQIGGVSVAAVAKGTQATNAMGVQDFKDSGRVSFVAVGAAVVGVTTEALITLTPVRTVTAGSTGTSLTVTSGKTMRLQGMTITVRNTSTTQCGAIVRLRMTAGTVSATSQEFFAVGTTALGAISGQSNQADIDFPDGFEISGTTQFGISQLASATTCTLDVTLYGFEY